MMGELVPFRQKCQRPDHRNNGQYQVVTMYTGGGAEACQHLSFEDIETNLKNKLGDGWLQDDGVDLWWVTGDKPDDAEGGCYYQIPERYKDEAPSLEYVRWFIRSNLERGCYFRDHKNTMKYFMTLYSGNANPSLIDAIVSEFFEAEDCDNK